MTGKSGGTKVRRKYGGSLAAMAGLLGLIGAGLVVLAPGASASVVGRVLTTNGDVLHIRSTPSKTASVLGTLAPNSLVSFSCYVQGDPDTGPYGTETVWDQLDAGGYVPDAWIYTGSNSSVVPQCAAAPAPPPVQSGPQYRIAWTGGIGVYPRSGTSMGSAKVGAALAEGAVITLACETTGQSVTDTAGYVSSIWDQLPNGTYVSNAYINTGVNGRTPGVPACSGGSSGGSSGGDAPDSCDGPRSSGSYDGWGACEWAIHNVNTPARFQDDCTWFVSQALWQGDLPKSSAWTSASWNWFNLAVQKPGSSKGPYAYPGPTVDSASAPDLVNYLLAHKFATEKVIPWSDNTAGGAKIGDVIAYHWNQVGRGHDASLLTIDHLSIVTGFSGSYPLVSQHTYAQSNRGWSWDLSTNNWIQYSFPKEIQPIAFLIHITG